MSNRILVLACGFSVGLVTVDFRTAVADDTKPAEAIKYGSISGKVLYEGLIPKREVLIEKGDVKFKDVLCTTETIYSERLLIDAKNRGVANVVFYLRKKPEHVHPELESDVPDEIFLEVSGCRFKPHITLIRTSQTVRLSHGAGEGHNAHPHALKNPNP